MGSGMVGNRHAPLAAIRTNKAASEPTVGERKRLHLDLLGSSEENRHNLSELSKNLERIAPLSETKISLTLSSEHEYLAKFSEMMGHPLSYQITHKLTYDPPRARLRFSRHCPRDNTQAGPGGEDA